MNEAKELGNQLDEFEEKECGYTFDSMTNFKKKCLATRIKDHLLFANYLNRFAIQNHL